MHQGCQVPFRTSRRNLGLLLTLASCPGLGVWAGFSVSWIICKASSMLWVPTWLPSSSKSTLHRPQRPAGSTHSSTRGLRPPELQANRSLIHSQRAPGLLCFPASSLLPLISVLCESYEGGRRGAEHAEGVLPRGSAGLWPFIGVARFPLGCQFHPLPVWHMGRCQCLGSLNSSPSCASQLSWIHYPVFFNILSSSVL